MPRILIRHLLAGLLLLLCSSLASAASLSVTDLTCERLVNPEGIEALAPELSWILESSERGQRQTAYEILVATRPELLEPGKADLWNSGKVASDRNIHVVYSGKPLVSCMPCYWKVRAWDKSDKPSPWSKPCFWSMGLLKADDWKSQWLGFTSPRPRDPKMAPELKLDDCQWIWTPESDPRVEVPAGVRYFRNVIELPKDAVVAWAYMVLAADDRYELWVNGSRASISRKEPKAWLQAYEIELTYRLHGGRNTIGVEVTNAEPGPAALVGKVVVRLADGQTLVSATSASWKMSTKPVRNWMTESFDDSSWKSAQELGKVGMKPWKIPQAGNYLGWLQKAPSPLLRKEFTLDKPIRRATAFICGLGYYELRLNGNKVGDHVLDPPFTRYDRTSLYVTYPVTSQLKQGKNAIGVMLGNGWYNMHTRATWDFDQAPWRGEPRMTLQLIVEFADGTTKTIVSDASWRASTGPIVLDSIRAGERYDARYELPGWDRPDFDDAAWKTPVIMDPPGGVLRARNMPPCKVTQTIKPLSVRQTRPGVFLFDMGQNIAGWAQLTVSGPKGVEVTLRYSERIHKDGSLDREEIRKFVFAGPFQTDTYTLKGEGKEVWEPRFTYHGFCYVEVSGLPEKPTLDTLRGRVVHTAFANAGGFTCSNALLNQIQQATIWSYRGNFHGYPTDCPHREKNGWTGDAHLAAEQAMYNFQNDASYLKWLCDFSDEQRDSGELPAILPTSGWGYAWGNGPAWDSAYLLIPWYLYQYRGDQRVLADHYDRMRLYVDYLGTHAKDHIVSIGLGDWVPADTVTPVAVTSTAYYYIDALIVSSAAEILGKKEDAKKYAALAEQIQKAFCKAFCSSDTKVANNSQTALSCAIYQGLVDGKRRDRLVAQLVKNIKAHQDHLDVGILGAKYLLHTLSENGHHDLAYRLITQTTAPSYGNWFENGTTTLLESWEGNSPLNHSPLNHSSLNHIAFGDISTWFYQTLGGINLDPSVPAFKQIILRPQPVGDLKFVECSHRSPYGTIASYWKIEGDKFQWDIHIPANTAATVYVPAANAQAVTESGKPATFSQDVQLVRTEPGVAVFSVSSGKYRFESTLPPH